MARSTEILNELAAISTTVSGIGAKMPYSLPDDYFDTLDTVIMARIAAGGHEETSLLQTLDKEMLQTVPEGYFDGLAGTIMSKIKSAAEPSVEEELQTLSSVLAGINRTNPYEVPSDYFDSLAGNITSKANEAKVVSLFSQKIWKRFAVAAAFILFAGFGLKFFMQNRDKQETVSAIPQIKTEEQIKTELAQISDEEIINYLKANADAKDAEVIASLVDQSKLPNEADYMDDAFLESFMKELEKTDQKTN
ncbi:MAG: hypothetical protein QM725_16545 [Lacibacter sp.]